MLVMLVFCIYGTIVPLLFGLATSELQEAAVYFGALALKVGGGVVLKKVVVNTKIPFYAIAPGLFLYELVASTQLRILLASYPDTNVVFYYSIATGFAELAGRLKALDGLRGDGRGYEEKGWTEPLRVLFKRMEWVFVAVSWSSFLRGGRQHRCRLVVRNFPPAHSTMGARLHASPQDVQGDMLVDYLSPITALLLAFYFTNNTAFTFGDAFRKPGTVVGGTAFFDQLQQKLYMNLLAQIGPEILCDLACIATERFYGMGEKADEYWGQVLSPAGLLVYLPMFALGLAVNIAIILLTGRTSCELGQCVRGY